MLIAVRLGVTGSAGPDRRSRSSGHLVAVPVVNDGDAIGVLLLRFEGVQYGQPAARAEAAVTIALRIAESVASSVVRSQEAVEQHGKQGLLEATAHELETEVALRLSAERVLDALLDNTGGGDGSGARVGSVAQVMEACRRGLPELWKVSEAAYYHLDLSHVDAPSSAVAGGSSLGSRHGLWSLRGANEVALVRQVSHGPVRRCAASRQIVRCMHTDASGKPVPGAQRLQEQAGPGEARMLSSFVGMERDEEDLSQAHSGQVHGPAILPATAVAGRSGSQSDGKQLVLSICIPVLASPTSDAATMDGGGRILGVVRLSVDESSGEEHPMPQVASLSDHVLWRLSRCLSNALVVASRADQLERLSMVESRLVWHGVMSTVVSLVPRTGGVAALQQWCRQDLRQLCGAAEVELEIGASYMSTLGMDSGRGAPARADIVGTPSRAGALSATAAFHTPAPSVGGGGGGGGNRTTEIQLFRPGDRHEVGTLRLVFDASDEGGSCLALDTRIEEDLGRVLGLVLEDMRLRGACDALTASERAARRSAEELTAQLTALTHEVELERDERRREEEQQQGLPPPAPRAVLEAGVMGEILHELAGSLLCNMSTVEEICLVVATQLPGLLGAERAMLFLLDESRDSVWSVVPRAKTGLGLAGTRRGGSEPWWPSAAPFSSTSSAAAAAAATTSRHGGLFRDDVDRWSASASAARSAGVAAGLAAGGGGELGNLAATTGAGMSGGAAGRERESQTILQEGDDIRRVGRLVRQEPSGPVLQAIQYLKPVHEEVLVRRGGDEDYEQFDQEYSIRNVMRSSERPRARASIWVVPVLDAGKRVLGVLQVMSPLEEHPSIPGNSRSGASTAPRSAPTVGIRGRGYMEEAPDLALADLAPGSGESDQRKLQLQPRLSEASLCVVTEVVALTVTLAQRNRRLLDDRIRTMKDQRLDESTRCLAERDALTKALSALAGAIDEAGFFAVVSRCVPAICGGADGAQLFLVHHHIETGGAGQQRPDGSVPSRVWTRALDGSQALSQIDASESLIGLAIRERRAINTTRLDAPPLAGPLGQTFSGAMDPSPAAGAANGGFSAATNLDPGLWGDATAVGHGAVGGLYPISATPHRAAPAAMAMRVLVAPVLSPATGKAIGAVQVTAMAQQEPGSGSGAGIQRPETAPAPGFTRAQEEAVVHLCAAMASAWDLRDVMTTDRMALRTTSERLKASREDRTVARLRGELAQAQQEVADLRDSLATSAASTKAWVERDQKESRAQQDKLRRLESQLEAKEAEVSTRLDELERMRLQLDAKHREAKAVEREKLQVSSERDEVLAKLVQYRKHVKQARKVMEEAMEEEQQKRRTEMESVRMLQSKLEETQRQMADLQKTYHVATESGQAERLHYQSLSAELDAISKENRLLKNQQKVLHHKLKSLATLEASDLKNQSPTSR